MLLDDRAIDAIKAKLGFYMPTRSDNFGRLCGPFTLNGAYRSSDPLYAIEVHDGKPALSDGLLHDYWLLINPNHYNGEAGAIPQAAVASTWRTASGELAFADWRDYQLTQES